MQAKNGTIIATVIICAVLLAGAMYLMRPDPVVMPNVPTAADIAAKINVSIPVPSNSQLQEIWDEIYSTEVNALERDARRACEREFDFDDLEDLFPDAHSVRFEDLDEDDYDFTILDLGLDDEDDRHATFNGYFTASYIPDEGQQTRVNDRVYGECVVTSDDGDLEADLTLSL